MINVTPQNKNMNKKFAFKPTQKAFIFTNMNKVQHKRNIHLET